METDTIYLFTRNGIGSAPQELQHRLVKKFLSVALESGSLPAAMIFYTDGVKLACQGSPVLEELRALEKAGARLILCQTCLTYFNLEDKVEVGIVGGMGDIVEALNRAWKVVSL